MALPADDLLYVGRSTKHNLYKVCTTTPCDLVDIEDVKFSNGFDQSPVAAPTHEAGTISISVFLSESVVSADPEAMHEIVLAKNLLV